MSEIKKTLTETALALSVLLFGENGNHKPKKEQKPKREIVYLKPRHLTDEERAKKKAHKKVIKSRRKGKKGIYSKKIKYKKAR